MYGYKNGQIPRGAILRDGKVVAETFMCCHCGIPFYYHLDHKTGKRLNPGGHVKSFCALCNWLTCGRSGCDLHIPFEAKIEFIEAEEVQNIKAMLALFNSYPDFAKLIPKPEERSILNGIST